MCSFKAIKQLRLKVPWLKDRYLEPNVHHRATKKSENIERKVINNPKELMMFLCDDE